MTRLRFCDDPSWTPSGTKLGKPAAGKHVVVVQVEAFDSGKGKEFAVARGRPSYHRNKFQFRPGDLEPWPGLTEAEIHIFPAWGWVNAILSVAKVDHEQNVAYVTNGNCTQELRPGNRYFVANVLEVLDEPGEWCVDRRQGRVFLLAGGG